MTGNLGHDLKVAFRTIVTQRAFSAMVIGMLALGIAGNVAIFSIFNGLFLRPLPFSEPERLVDINERAPKWNLRTVGVSHPDFYEWKKSNSTFESMAFFDDAGFNLVTEGEAAQRVTGAFVTHDFMNVLRLTPFLGRNFTQVEDKKGGDRVVLLGHGLWERVFHSDRSVLGRSLKLNDQPHTIIGVLPKEAVFPSESAVWVPLQADPSEGGGWYLSGVGRLKPGITIDQAIADLTRIHKAMIKGMPREVNEVTFPTVMTLRERYLGDFRRVSQVLLAGVGVVLLIACVNIAGLMMVRGAGRAREIAIRGAIGASRGVIVRQLLTETVVLASIGGVAGILLGNALLRGMLALLPDIVPTFIRFNMDWRFTVFAFGLTAAAAIFCGLAPAIQTSGIEPRAWLQDGARSSSSKARRFALSGMVVAEIGLALILLISAGLLLQAFRRVVNVDPGFRAQGLLSYTVSLPRAKYNKPEQGPIFYDKLADLTRAIPGVSSSAITSLMPLGGHSGTFFNVEGYTPGPNDQNPVILQIQTSPSYFETLGLQFTAGRAFTEQEGNTPENRVVVVNESFAKRFWPNTSAIGKRIKYNGAKADWMQVVGVTRDVRHYGLDQEMRPCVVMPIKQRPATGFSVVMRTTGDPKSLTSGARDALRQVDADLPMYDVRTMTDRMDRSLWARRAYSWLFSAFALTAILLAAAGIYGVVSYAVGQRTREIGIRMALGARPEQVLRNVLGSGMTLVGIGLVLGIAGSLVCVRYMSTLLFGVSTTDWLTYVLVIVSVTLVGLLANFVPARRAASLDPMLALRIE